MTYATQDDIVSFHGDRVLKVVADRNKDGTPEAATVTLALESATAEIDSYLRERYTVPLSTPGPMIKTICVDIAVYRMALSESSCTENMIKRYESALAWLKDIAAGKASLEATNIDGGDGGQDAGAQDVTGGKRAGFFFSTR